MAVSPFFPIGLFESFLSSSFLLFVCVFLSFRPESINISPLSSKSLQFIFPFLPLPYFPAFFGFLLCIFFLPLFLCPCLFPCIRSLFCYFVLFNCLQFCHCIYYCSFPSYSATTTSILIKQTELCSETAGSTLKRWQKKLSKRQSLSWRRRKKFCPKRQVYPEKGDNVFCATSQLATKPDEGSFSETSIFTIPTRCDIENNLQWNWSSTSQTGFTSEQWT